LTRHDFIADQYVGETSTLVGQTSNVGVRSVYVLEHPDIFLGTCNVGGDCNPCSTNRIQRRVLSQWVGRLVVIGVV